MSCEFDCRKYEKYHKEKNLTWNPLKYIIKIIINYFREKCHHHLKMNSCVALLNTGNINFKAYQNRM